jgi:DNA ligase 1
MFAFDILYFNGNITQLPLIERREYLAKLQPILSSDILRISEHSEVEEIEKIDEFLTSAIKFGTEGLMIKDLDSPYTCSRRSWEWVKLKKDYIDGLGDTLDLVPIGAVYGVGKRKGLYGSYLLAAYNSDMEVFETICKIGTGFSDEVLTKAYEFFQDKLAPSMPKQYRISEAGDTVDVWFTPSAVWEVKGADFQVSPLSLSSLPSTPVVSARQTPTEASGSASLG